LITFALEKWEIDFAFQIIPISIFLPKQGFDLLFALSFVAFQKKVTPKP
jgi:hypothetical protein